MKTIYSIATELRLKVEPFLHPETNKIGYILYCPNNQYNTEEFTNINGKDYPEVITFYPTKTSVWDVYDYLQGVIHYSCKLSLVNRFIGLSKPTTQLVRSVLLKTPVSKSIAVLFADSSTVLLIVYNRAIDLIELNDLFIGFDVVHIKDEKNKKYFNIGVKKY